MGGRLLAVVRYTFKVRIRSTPGGFYDLETTFGVRDGDLKQQVVPPVIACADQSHGVAASGLCRLWVPPPAGKRRLQTPVMALPQHREWEAVRCGFYMNILGLYIKTQVYYEEVRPKTLISCLVDL